MRVSLVSVIAIASVTGWLLTVGSATQRGSDSRTPILVELFTSEGCSSCPPADELLSKLDKQPLASAELIVLSEHVDYWDNLGWKDPYSSHFYTDRQGAYASRFGSEDVYTPQMVVDGTYAFVGSSSRSANQAFSKALNAPKVPVHLSSIALDGTSRLHAHIETGAVPTSFDSSETEVYLAVALNRAESHVVNGENGGRILAHTAVVRNLAKIGTLRSGQSFMQDIELKVQPGTDADNLRLIAFLQEPHQGRVLGVTLELVGAK